MQYAQIFRPRLICLAIVLLFVSRGYSEGSLRISIKNIRTGYQATISAYSDYYLGYKASILGEDIEFKSLPAGRYVLRIELENGAMLNRIVSLDECGANGPTTVATFDSAEATFPDDWEGGSHAVSVQQLARPKAVHAALKRAWDAMQENRLGDARKALREAIDVDPDCVDAWTNLGLISEWQGKLEVAERYHRRALALDPDAFATNINLSSLLAKREKAEEAIEYGIRAAKLRPDDLGINLHLGGLFAQARRFADSVVYLEKARSIQADSLGDAQVVLAVCYVETGQIDKGIAEVSDWLNRNPSHEKRGLLLNVRDELLAARRKTFAGGAESRDTLGGATEIDDPIGVPSN